MSDTSSHPNTCTDELVGCVLVPGVVWVTWIVRLGAILGAIDGVIVLWDILRPPL